MSVPQYAFDRVPFHLYWRETSSFKETYGGAVDQVLVEGQYLRPITTGPNPAPSCRSVVIFMHPTGVMNLLPMTNAMAAAGIPTICAASRYPHNDSGLIMEKVAADLGAYVRYAREKLGFEKVVLAGWSGGGSLSLFYQAQAEHPSLTHTPAGDEFDLTQANLIPADGVMQLAAHVSRAITLTEWIDASILDENNPNHRDPELDLYGDLVKPPYSQAFLDRYRAAQIARSARIDAWVQTELEALKHNPRGEMERAFVVHGTMADPRWLDPMVDPNDRQGPNWCYMGVPSVVNMSPAGLARYSSLRSWLSQWSFSHSRADGPRCAGQISVPVLVIENSADDACTPSHTRRIFEGVGHGDKEIQVIQGASHYYLGQPDKMAKSVAACLDWMRRKGFVS
jgi:alpha-beta hydrolase superfamily lysophospholipase